MIKKTPLVSVIIPVYNVELYIGDCLDSVISQTYCNIEIIIVDDGSTDDSGIIADVYAKKDKRIRVIHKNNTGVASARNIGINAANGIFILFVDSDDWISIDHISHLMELQALHDSDMCLTTKYFTKNSDKQTGMIKVEQLSNVDACILLLSPKLVIGTYNKLYRKSWLIKNNIKQNEKLFSGEGLNFIVTAAEHANHVTISNKRIYYYRRNVSESATTKFNINMFINNELSLDILEREKIIDDARFDEMLCHFRIQLMISGMIAVINNKSTGKYRCQFQQWRKKSWKAGRPLLRSKSIEPRYKIRIVAGHFIPHIWAKLAKTKRNKAYSESV